MKFKFRILIILALVLIGGCQIKWVKLDGSSATDTKLQKARTTCRVDKKLAGLERAEKEKNREVKAAKTKASKQALKQEYEAVVITVYREIDICMHKQGLKRTG